MFIEKGSSNVFKVTLKKSLIGCSPAQRRTLAALGLKRIRQAKTLQESPAVAGMIENVKHLIEVGKS